MSSPSDALPVELDFAKDPDASSERMNRAMAYLVAALRAANARRLDYGDAIEELRAVGLARLAEALAPIVTTARLQGDAIAAAYAAVVSGGALAALKADILALVNPRLGAAEAAIAANAASDAAAIGAVAAANAATATAIAAAEIDRWFHSHG